MVGRELNSQEVLFPSICMYNVFPMKVHVQVMLTVKMGKKSPVPSYLVTVVIFMTP